MGLGECTIGCFQVLRSDPTATTDTVLDLPLSDVTDCCFKVKVLAKIGGTKFENDKSSWVWWYDIGFTNADLFLQKNVNGVWTDLTEVTDLTLCDKFNDYGVNTNNRNEKLLSVVIDWEKVLTVYGVGGYRLKTEDTTIFGGAVQNQYSFEYCLSVYTENTANKTVRISWYNKNIIGSHYDDSKTLDFGDLVLYNEIRFCESFFGYTKSDFTTEYTKYNNGEKVWIGKEKTDEYFLRLWQLPFYIHIYNQSRMLMSDKLIVTNYNNNANSNFQEKIVSITESLEYAPEITTRSKLSNVDLKFSANFENFNQKRC